MDSTNSYLQNLLKSQDLKPEQERTLQVHKEEVASFLRAEFGDDPIIKYAGSREKGTMIRDNYDLDIVCYFPSTDTRSLKEIRGDVSDHLNKKYVMEDKASAERILSLKGSTTPHGYHIDVVPGRFIEGSSDVFLHLAGEGDKERLLTNLKTHINYISKSGCVPVIRLAKIWAHRNHIDVKTFVLELFVVDALSGSRTKDNLKISFLKVLEVMKDRFAVAQLIDPANANNIVSRLVSATSKAAVVRAAEETFNLLNDSNELADWISVLGELDTDMDLSSHIDEKNEVITAEDAAEITLGDYAHRERPRWPKNIQGSVEIIKCVVNGRNNLGSNGWPIPDGCSLNYVAGVSGISGSYEVWWQVVNTGAHAASVVGGLRGKIEEPKNPSCPLEQTESSLYTGRHWVQCYIVQSGYLIAESKPFFLNVVNKSRKKIRVRHR